MWWKVKGVKVNCPNKKLILDYAKKRGLKKAKLLLKDWWGWELVGTKREADRPLVWAICEELKMSRGCGGSDFHQCSPNLATLPEESRERVAHACEC